MNIFEKYPNLKVFCVAILLVVSVVAFFMTSTQTIRDLVTNWSRSNGFATIYQANCTLMQVVNNWGVALPTTPGNCDGNNIIDAIDLALSLANPPADQSGGNTQPPQQSGNDALFLTPGSGFSGPTAQPAPVGNASASGYTAKAIARFTTVPFQMINSGEEIRVGVVAFHANGIQKVSFSANGGAWIDSTEMQKNPATNVAEYWVKLKAADFPDGKVEVRAIAWPKTSGVPLVLAGNYQETINKVPYFNGVYSLILWTNGAGSLTRTPKYISAQGNDTTGDGTLQNPFLTLSKATEKIQLQYGSVDGAVIYALPGTYSFNMKWGTTFAKANDRFVTITTAPGVNQNQVIITEARPKTARIHLKNVTLETNSVGNFYTGYGGADPRTILWLDKVKINSLGGRYVSPSADLVGTASYYVTDSDFSDMPNGPTSAILVMNTEVTKLKSDMVTGTQTVVNVTGSDIDAANTGAHPDVYQIYKPGPEDGTGNGQMDNYILYGLNVKDFTAQGIFVAALAPNEIIKNTAFVNVSLDANSSNFTSQINKTTDNVLFVNNTIKQTLFLRAVPGPNTNYIGNLFSAVTLDLTKVTPTQMLTANWNHNHFVSAPPSYGTYVFGNDYTTGAPPVTNWSGGDFEPLENSILTNRVPSIFSIHDVFNEIRHTVASLGAVEGKSTPCVVPNITSSNSSSGSVSSSFSHTISSSGSSATYSVSGVLPAGLSFSDNKITGTPTLAGTFPINITATNGCGTDTDPHTITIAPALPSAPTVSFSGSPSSVTTGNTATLTWSSTNATECVASNGWSGTKSTSGSEVTQPLSQTTTFVITCTGGGGSKEKSKTITVTTPDQPGNPGGGGSGGSSDPVAFYELNGDVNDSAGNNNGTIVGSPTFDSGHSGQAIKLSGVGQYVKAASTITGYPFTLAGWANGNGTVVSLIDSDYIGSYYALRIISGVPHMLARYNAGAEGDIAGPALSAGWHHLVGVFTSATDRKFYVDGVLVGTQNTSKLWTPGVDGIVIGVIKIVSPFGYFSGLIDDVRVYNTALGAGDVSTMFGL